MQTPETSGPTLIGMLTPSSNTVVEPFTAALAWPLFPQVSVHFGRLRVTRIALDEGSDDQFGIDPFLAAADLLADAKVDVIAWNGTSASWLGFDSDDRLCAELTERTGARATTAIKSLNTLIEAFGVKKLGLVTPYTPDVQQQIIANYAEIGVETVAERHSNRSDNFSFAEVPEAEIERMQQQAVQSMAQRGANPGDLDPSNLGAMFEEPAQKRVKLGLLMAEMIKNSSRELPWQIALLGSRPRF